MRRVDLSDVVRGLCLVVGAALGCGRQDEAVYPASGVVRFVDGTPVTWGVVEFHSRESGVTARGRVEPDGAFRLSTFAEFDGAVVGRHRAILMQVVLADKLRAVDHRHGAVAAPRYSSYEASGLEFEIRPEPNRLEVVVERAVRLHSSP